MHRSSVQALLAVVTLASLSSVTGCAALRRLAGNDTINLEKAEVKTMSVDIRRQQKTICPRESVQMAIFADVVLDGDKAPKPLETWKGRGSVNKNDKLDFVDFAFQSDQGAFGGTTGHEGPSGSDGSSGKSGQSGSDKSSGGEGGDGGSGTSGGSGAD